MVDPSTEIVYLYVVKHTILNIIYIGITNDTTRRFGEHKNHSSSKLLRHYIGIYGSKEFTFNILCTGTRSEMEELEGLAISELLLMDRYIACNVLAGSVSTGASSQVGSSHWNAKFTEEDIELIRSMYSMGGITQKTIGDIYGCSNKVISKITGGTRWKNTLGTISNNIVTNKVANRRKLTDAQCIQVRNESQEEYLALGTISVPAIAELYGVSRHSMRLLLKGEVYPNLGGPLLGIDYYKDFGR